jgi:ABC-type multidrug transport system ATPase subunit
MPVVTTSAVLEMSDVAKRFGRNPWVLRQVDLRLEPGQVVAVSAANGAGKSTLLRLMVGATRPSAGRIGGIGRRSASSPRATPRRLPWPRLC